MANSRQLEALERRINLLIPTCVHAAFEAPRLPAEWQLYTPDRICSLRTCTPNVPLGCIPLMYNAGGDQLCLYFHRSKEPLVAVLDHETGVLDPVEDTVDDFFHEPMAYLDDRGDYFKPVKALQRWDRLTIDISGSAVSELLKPLEIRPNARILDRERTCLHDFNEHCSLNPLLQRVRDWPDVSECAELIGRAFSSSSVSDTLDWFRWYRLGCQFAKIGKLDEAVDALSNARFVAMFVSPMWAKCLYVVQKLVEVLTVAGPRLYLEQAKNWLPTLEEWSE